MRKQQIKLNRSVLSLVGVVVLALGLSACSAKDKEDMNYKFDNLMKQDRSLDYDRDDYRRALAPRPIDKKATSIGAVPDFAPVIANTPEDILPQPLVSISVNQTIPLRDILFELAEQADVDLELDPNIRGSIIFTARERPFDQVVERISNLAGLRYTYEDNVLRVELDTPYIETYHVDYLSMSREFESDIQSSISVLSGDGANSGSNNLITSKNSNDLWAELETNITQILQNSGRVKGLSRSTRPLALPDAIPAVTTAQLLENSQGEVQISGAPGDQVFDEAEEDQEEEEEVDSEIGNYSINKQAGLISVYASKRQHKLVSEYLNKMRRSLTTQVLIEAKVLEVGLDDEFGAGIDWDTLFSGDFNVGVNFPRVEFSQAAASGTASVGVTGSDFNLLAEFVQRFGNVHTLSSPRLTVMNNQSAILNVAENQVFFEIDISRTPSTVVGVPDTIEVDSEIRNVPEGVIISVHPSIDMNTNEITLSLRPSITRVIDTVPEPAAASLGVDNDVPVLAVRELDSIVKMGSGEIIVMGGLMQDQVQGVQTGIPVLSELPGFLGGVFRSQRDQIQKTEMVILIRATIADRGPGPDSVDKDMFNKFSSDRRPFPM